MTQDLRSALVVDDDAARAAVLRQQLGRAGFVVQARATPADALHRIAQTTPSVVILALTFPDTEGADLCLKIRELHAQGDVPILCLSGTADLSTKLKLFALGVDDYVVSPCDPMELVARLHALLRRRGDQRAMRRVGPLRVALGTGDAWLSETRLELTAGERSVLTHLARAFPGISPRSTLDRTPWRTGDSVSNVTEVLVGRLRRKIDRAGGGVEILAIRRSGYVLRPRGVVSVTG
ncbi:MAG: response regulator transcription factor [Chloroflexota bacterium]|nr:response regulator transcription factor [Chloroflexota bacterium]